MKVSLSSIKQDELVALDVGVIKDNSSTDFDLFVKVGNHTIVYGSPGYNWRREELESLLRAGYPKLFYLSKDMGKAQTFLRLGKLGNIENHLPPQERIVVIEQIASDFVRALHEEEITPAVVKKGEEIVEGMSRCILEDKSCVKFLSGLGDYDVYTYRHSVRTASYSLAIAIEMGTSDPQVFRDIGIGGLFHDIGKKDVPLEILHKSGALTDDEWGQMKAHPTLGYKAIGDKIGSYVPREIVLHHHEKLDGSGYPDALEKRSIIDEVQIATLADVFDALTSTRSYQNKRTRFEALDFIRHKMLGAKIAPEPFKALISCLA